MGQGGGVARPPGIRLAWGLGGLLFFLPHARAFDCPDRIAAAPASPPVVLAMPDGNALAHTTRALQVSEALRRHGYEVVFATDGRYVPLIRNSGFVCEPHLSLDPARVMEICRRGRADYYSPEFLESCVQADCRLFAEKKPALVLSDFRFSVSTSAELARVPHAVLLNALWTNYFDAPLSAPESTVFTRWIGRSMVKLLSPFFFGVVREMYLRWDNRAHNQVRRRHGLAPRANLFDLIRGDLNLIADLPSFGPTRDLPESFAYVGPLVWQPNLPVPEWLDELDPSRRTLYISMGSSGDPKLFGEAIRLFGGGPHQCILTTAGLVNIPDAPANVKVVDFAPGDAVMKKADLVICQGGNGTLYQAIRAGVPIIGYPTMHDQHWNMEQVERLGLGKALSLMPFDPALLKTTVEEVLGQADTYRAHARPLQAEFGEFDGAERAAQAIDVFLGNGVK